MAAVTAKTDTPSYTAPTASERAGRYGVLLTLLLVGLAIGTVGSFLHRAEFSTAGVNWPDGLVLSLGGLVGALLAIAELAPVLPSSAHSAVPGRLGATGILAAGWVLAVIWLTYIGPPFSFQNKGDVILANDWRSIGFLIIGMCLATVFLYRAWLATLEAKLARARG